MDGRKLFKESTTFVLLSSLNEFRENTLSLQLRCSFTASRPVIRGGLVEFTCGNVTLSSMPIFTGGVV
eukprot:1475042-Rhodomonas_salina.2